MVNYTQSHNAVCHFKTRLEANSAHVSKGQSLCVQAAWEFNSEQFWLSTAHSQMVCVCVYVCVSVCRGRGEGGREGVMVVRWSRYGWKLEFCFHLDCTHRDILCVLLSGEGCGVGGVKTLNLHQFIFVSSL